MKYCVCAGGGRAGPPGEEEQADGGGGGAGPGELHRGLLRLLSRRSQGPLWEGGDKAGFPKNFF